MKYTQLNFFCLFCLLIEITFFASVEPVSRSLELGNFPFRQRGIARSRTQPNEVVNVRCHEILEVTDIARSSRQKFNLVHLR